MNDLFSMDLDSGMGFLDKKDSKTNDGILRLDPKKAKDGKKGLRVVLRFLPNFTREGKLGQAAIEKFVHFVKLQNHPELNGYYDSMKNFNEKCELTNTFWELKNSKSVIDQEKAQLISRTTKYYSYVQIIEHESEPELVGKIMIFPFGIKIKNKINEERTGEITGTPNNVYDLVNGKDFVCIVKEIGGFPNYDASQFKPTPSPIQIPSKDGSLREVPTVDNDGRKVVDPKVQERVREYLLSREVNLEDYSAIRWDEETHSKVLKIVSILKDNPIISANSSIASASKKSDATFFEDDDVNETTSAGSSKKDEDDFFDF
jgi:hypothetical protein